MLKGDALCGQRLTEGHFLETLFARQRQPTHVHDQLNAGLLQAFDERLYRQAFVAERVKRAGWNGVGQCLVSVARLLGLRTLEKRQPE
jgi:hypothetical protein